MRQGDLLKPDVRGKLSSLKRKIKLRLAGEGAAWLVLAIVGLILATLGLDYLLRLDRAPRIVLMLAAAASLVYVARRYLVLPLRVPMDDENLALLVERRYGSLSDRLISAIQFSWAKDVAPGTSRAMIEHVAEEANSLAQGLEFEQVVEKRNLHRMARLAICAVALLAGFGTWQSGAMGLWFQRNVMFREIPWPQDTYLAVLNARNQADFYVLRGDDLTVAVGLDERTTTVPQYVVFHANYASVGSTEERVDLGADGRTYTKVFQAVSEEFTFYVTGGDDKRDKATPHHVRLIDPPALKDVEYSITFPHYMNRGDSPYEPIKGIMAVPLGSEINFRATSSKDLAPVTKMLLDDREVGSIEITNDGDGRKRRVIGRFGVSGANQLVSHMLRFALTDTDGYSNRRGQQFMIQVQPDLSPQVELKSKGIGTSITPRATIPLIVVARDDYGLAAAAVRVQRIHKAATQESQPASAPTGRPAATQTTQATQKWGVPSPVLPGPDGGKDFTGPHRMDLDTLDDKPVPDDVISVSCDVEDTMASGLGGPNGKTAALEFKIVTELVVQTDLARRQMDIALEFSQALLTQATSLEKTRKSLEEASSGAIADANNMRANLTQSRDEEVQVGVQVSRAADQLWTIYEEMVNNRVFQAEQGELANEVVKPLQELSGPITSANVSLTRAEELLKSGNVNADQVKEILAGSVEVQQQILNQLNVIHEKMKKMNDRQAFINQVLALKETWKKVLDDTNKARGEEIKGLLPTSASKPAGGK